MYHFTWLSNLLLIGLLIPANPITQNNDEPHEMIATEAGLTAMDTPEGWRRADGPGLAFFIREKDTPGDVQVFMYISLTPFGPKEDAKTADAVLASDISGFKKRFKNGSVQKEEDIDLPRAKSRATVYTFVSHETNNAFEQIAYIRELNRVLIICLSARDNDRFQASRTAFRAFVHSYGGSVGVIDGSQK